GRGAAAAGRRTGPTAGATARLNVTQSSTSRSRSCEARLVEDGGCGPTRHSRLAQARAKILERGALRRAGQRILEELRHLGGQSLRRDLVLEDLRDDGASGDDVGQAG